MPLVGMAPTQQAACATGANIVDLLEGVVQPIQANGLVAGLGIGVLRVQIGGLKFMSLGLGEAKGARIHAADYDTFI